MSGTPDLEHDYQQTLDFLFSQLPMFQRVGAAAYKADLTTTQSLCSILGNPEQRGRFVHVAGTNGKGSVSHMLASVLHTAGYKTGLFTSPHLRDFRERIKINGDPIAKAAVVDFVERNKAKWERLQPSFFEMTFAMAVWYFDREKCDVVVLETGMGGRLDSTNVVKPEVSVITTIGLDHAAFLGNTVEAIAREKAGIIKATRPVVIGRIEGRPLDVILERAAAQRAPVHRSTELHDDLPPLDLKGSFQTDNARTAITAARVLRQRGYSISDTAIAQGLGHVAANTGLLGRWQVLNERPLTIADCAHNEDGWRVVLENLTTYDYHDLHMVIGFSGDKDLDALFELLPKRATYYFTAANVPRALAADELRERATAYGLRGEQFQNVRKALEAARLYAGTNDLIFIGGSVFVVAEVV